MNDVKNRAHELYAVVEDCLEWSISRQDIRIWVTYLLVSPLHDNIGTSLDRDANE